LTPLIAFLSGVVFFHTFQYFPYLTILFSIAVFVLMARNRKYALIILLALGIAYAFMRYSPQPEHAKYENTVTVSGFFKSPPVSLNSGFSQRFQVTSNFYPQTLDVLSDREFEIGRQHELRMKVITPKERLNPGSRQRDVYAVLLDVRSRGERINSIPVAVNRLRYRLQKFLEGSLEPDSAAFVIAVTTGQRAYLNADLRDAFNSAGLAHLLSISGTHFALFSVLLFGMFKVLVEHLPLRMLQRITVYLTPSQAAAVLTLPFMLFYLGISGASIPSIRAFIMISLFLFGLFVQRKGSWFNFLLLAAVVLVLWEPEVIFSISFQLSFIAVLFIGGAQSLFSARTGNRSANPDERRVCNLLPVRFFKKTLLISLSASVGVAPLVAHYFHYVSLISPAANFVVTPIVGFLLVPMSLIGSFLYLITGSYLIEPLVGWVAELSIRLVRVFASLPYSSLKIPSFPVVIIISFYAAFLLYWILKRKYILILLLLPVLVYPVFAINAGKPFSVTFLDAGHADASVLELPDGKVIVIDTGRSGREVANYLRLKAYEGIDALVLTHAHPDHAGGAEYLIKQFRVKELWDNGKLLYPEGFLDGLVHKTLKRGDFIEKDNYSIYILHPYNGFYTAYGDRNTEENNDSLVLKIKGRHKAFLFTGDIESEAEEDISHLGRWLKSDVIKVPHHGAKTSADEVFFREVSPQVAVVTARRLNPAMKQALKDTEILLTGIVGAVKVEERNTGLRIKTYREFMFKKTRHLSGELHNIKRLFTVW